MRFRRINTEPPSALGQLPGLANRQSLPVALPTRPEVTSVAIGEEALHALETELRAVGKTHEWITQEVFANGAHNPVHPDHLSFIVLERRAFRMPVRIAGRHVVRVEHPGLFDEAFRHGDGRLHEETGDDVAPRLLPPREVQRLRRLLGRLVRREAGPVVTPVAERRVGLFQIVLRLRQPVLPALCHGSDCTPRFSGAGPSATISCYDHSRKDAEQMAINIAHRRDLDARVERLAGRLALHGRGRKTAVIERALDALETQVERSRPDRAAILASLERYAAAGTRLRERQIDAEAADRRPLSLRLQDALYDERGLPR